MSPGEHGEIYTYIKRKEEEERRREEKKQKYEDNGRYRGEADVVKEAKQRGWMEHRWGKGDEEERRRLKKR